MKIAIGSILFITGLIAAVMLMSQSYNGADWYYPIIGYTGLLGLIIGPTLVFLEIGKRDQ